MERSLNDMILIEKSASEGSLALAKNEYFLLSTDRKLYHYIRTERFIVIIRDNDIYIEDQEKNIDTVSELSKTDFEVDVSITYDVMQGFLTIGSMSRYTMSSDSYFYPWISLKELDAIHKKASELFS